MINYNPPAILIVDDNPENLKIMVSALTDSEKEYDILTACNGKLACEIALKETPDLILMDWDMPVMNGIEALTEIKKYSRLKYIPVVMATGVMITLANLKEAFDAGASDFIRKPFDKIELLARVKAQLRYGDALKQILEQNSLLERREGQLTCAVADLEHNVSNKEMLLLNSALKIGNFDSMHKKLLNNIVNFKEQIVVNGSKGQILLNQIINTVKTLADENTWDHYELRFQAAHPRFFEGLRTDFPHLTPNDLRLCSLFSLNIESKEIARILNITPESLKVIRKRLRKKLNLAAEDNLVAFLARYN